MCCSMSSGGGQSCGVDGTSHVHGQVRERRGLHDLQQGCSTELYGAVASYPMLNCDVL